MRTKQGFCTPGLQTIAEESTAEETTKELRAPPDVVLQKSTLCYSSCSPKHSIPQSAFMSVEVFMRFKHQRLITSAASSTKVPGGLTSMSPCSTNCCTPRSPPAKPPTTPAAQPQAELPSGPASTSCFLHWFMNRFSYIIRAQSYLILHTFNSVVKHVMSFPALALVAQVCPPLAHNLRVGSSSINVPCTVSCMS